MRQSTDSSSIVRRGFLLAIALPIVCLPALADSPADTVDLYQLVDETVLQTQIGDRIAMAWWIPEEFWGAAFADEGYSGEGLHELVSLLRPYVLVAALEGEFDQSGELKLIEVPKLRKSLRLKDARGTEYSPLATEEVSPDAMLLALTMKPALVELLGTVVQDLEFFYFPARSPDGDPIAPAGGNGNFSVAVGEALFEWSLPLASVLPPRRCVVDGRSMNGAWIYCPWHGVRLVED